MVVQSLKKNMNQRGSSMIEVLVSIVIIAFGLLGLAGLQMRMQTSEMEAYQRSQALLLLGDMAGRIGANRTNANSYASSTTTYGSDYNCTAMGTGTVAQTDLKEWCTGLQGAAETTTSGGVTQQQGAMIGGRGCIESVGGDYFVTVTWQGLTPISAPPSSVTCGANSYNSGTLCVQDRCRRYVTTVVRIGSLL